MAQLAIKGHKTRGNEVIALLEMLGGKNRVGLFGDQDSDSYWMACDDTIHCGYVKSGSGYMILTLEEFEKKFPFKVGDEVDCIMPGFGVCKIVCMRWTAENDEVSCLVQRETESELYSMWVCAKDLRPYNPEPVETSPDKAKAPSLEGQDYSEGRCGYKIPEGFEFDKVENGEIILKPMKKELPKTYEECCEVLGISELPYMVYTWNRNEDVEVVLLEPQVTLLQQLEKLRRIITCRNAYWKLADDWSFKIGGNSQEEVYAITIWGTGILKDFYHALNCNRILVFPTEEMRDAFYENFRDLINECKELL